MHIDLASSTEQLDLTVDYFTAFVEKTRASLPAGSPVFAPAKLSVRDALVQLLQNEHICKMIIDVSRADVFSPDTAIRLVQTDEAIPLLRAVKILKYSYSIPCAQLFNALGDLVQVVDAEYAKGYFAFAERVTADTEVASLFMKYFALEETADPKLKEMYSANADYLEAHDPHAIMPTSVYRNCAGHVVSSGDSREIEATMSTTITTTISITDNVLDPANTLLSNVYRPLQRCVAVVDQRLDGLYGPALESYFSACGVKFDKLVYRCMEVDKDISTVQTILVDLKSRHVSRNEPVLVVGGGVMADIGGFACALYHRNTPYVMLSTSIVSAIDAGPSPRTCCDGLGYKNVFGAYHPPILNITDRSFFRTLHPGWIRHGLAEVIKMAVMKDGSLFELLEKAGNRLVETKLGIEECERGSEIDQLSDAIIAKAMDGYVRSEYGNLWETHQCRPHAYGHTWSPGFELQAGLLHGHAVAIGMGYGAYLSFLEGWIEEKDFHRILKVMSNLGLSLRHDILENTNAVWASQVKMTEKRGGNLSAPIPKGQIGKSGYLNEHSRERLERTLLEYQAIVAEYPRGGLGIDAHCHDVGLEDPSTVKQHAENAVSKTDAPENGHTDSAVPNGATNGATNGAATNGASNIATYNEWVKKSQVARNDGNKTSSALASELGAVCRDDTPNPPSFSHPTLFQDSVEEYTQAMTSEPSNDFVTIAEETKKAGLFAPCMVGAIEGEFLSMIASVTGAKRILDIGTFTGYSALAFAEGAGQGSQIVTVEADLPTAKVARKCFDASSSGDRIKLVEGDARKVVREMAESNQKFDIIFLDADKTNYRAYYEDALKMINDNGVIMADNALCSLLYDDSDPVRTSLHEFSQFVRADTRVKQVMLTVREGILMVRKV